MIKFTWLVPIVLVLYLLFFLYQLISEGVRGVFYQECRTWGRHTGFFGDKKVKGKSARFFAVIYLLLAVFLFFVLLVLLITVKDHFHQSSPSPLPSESTSETPTKKPELDTPFILTSDSIYGVWHQSESMPSSWSERYWIYHYDPIHNYGRYKFLVSDMDCASRERGHSGIYQLEGNILTLTIKAKTSWIGGRYIEGGGSCSTSKILIGASELTEPLKKPIVKKLTIEVPPQDYFRDKILINDVPYWRFDGEAKDEGFPIIQPRFGYHFEDSGQ